MKQILLIILLIGNIQAKTTQHDICQFKEVIKNGWSEQNQTLNQKIIILGDSEIPRIVKNLQYPLKADENKSNVPPFPKILVNRDDYVKLFAYSKYLESQNKTIDVIPLYISAYQGLNNIKMSSFFPFVYLIALHLDINKSLDSSLEHHIFTKKEKTLLYKELSSILTLDNHKLIETIKAEQDITLYFIRTSSKVDGDYAIDKQHLAIYKQLWGKAASKYYPTFISAIKNKTTEEMIEEKKKNRKSISIATHIKMKLLKLKLKIYNKLSININTKDYITLSTYMINKDLFMNTKAIDRTIKDYFKMVDDNKKLLQKIKETK